VTEPTPAASGPLAGLSIVDFSRVLAGPLATMMLGDLGADVLKIERPGTGDDTRAWTPPAAPDGTSTYYLAVNRNKRGTTLDLSSVDGQRTARDLAMRADVVVENFAPGTMERFGLGYTDLVDANPGLIYASVTGFGRGAGAALPGYDFLIQAVGGLMSITGDPDGPPTKAGVALVDVLAGQHLVIGILAALRHRERTGRGQRVDVDLLSSLLFGLVNQASAYLNAGVVPDRLGNAHPSIVPYQTLRTADRPIAVAVGTDAQFRALARTVGLADDGRFQTNSDRVRRRGELVDELERLLAHQPADHWIAALTAVGVPCGPVNSVADGFGYAEALGLDPVVRLPDPHGADGTDGTDGAEVASVANPVRLSGSPVSYRLAPPRLAPPRPTPPLAPPPSAPPPPPDVESA
jgi:crotonobetainyl-CoA:carnitine CoA-transferase CaiB-like acyl-CoA transferase